MATCIDKSALETSVDHEQLSVGRRRFLTVLGVFHVICFSLLVLVPGHTLALSWCSAALLSNAFVAVALTGPVSGRDPSRKWRSLWPFWLFVGYVFVLSMFISPGLLKSLSEGHFLPGDDVPNMPFSQLVIGFANRDFVIGVVSVLVLAVIGFALDRSWLKTKAFGWRSWLALGLLTLLMAWREYAVLIPPFLLACYGCYVAFAALGPKWLWQAVLWAVFAAAVPCLLMLLQAAQVAHSMGPTVCNGLSDWFYFTRYSPLLCPGGISMGAYVTWFPTFPPLFVALASCSWRQPVRLSKPWPVALVVSFALVLIGMVLCGRRSAYPALVVMALIGLVVTRRVKLRHAVPFVVACLLLLIALLHLGILDARLLRFFFDNSGHEKLGTIGVDLFRRAPILGIGPGRYGNITSMDSQYWPIVSNSGPHNDYIRLLCETGVIGFVLWVGAAICLLKALMAISRKGSAPETRALATALIVETIALSVTVSFTMEAFARPQWAWSNGPIFAAILGAAWSAGKAQERNPPTGSQRNLKMTP